MNLNFQWIFYGKHNHPWLNLGNLFHDLLNLSQRLNSTLDFSICRKQIFGPFLAILYKLLMPNQQDAHPFFQFLSGVQIWVVLDFRKALEIGRVFIGYKNLWDFMKNFLLWPKSFCFVKLYLIGLCRRKATFSCRKFNQTP